MPHRQTSGEKTRRRRASGGSVEEIGGRAHAAARAPRGTQLRERRKHTWETRPWRRYAAGRVVHDEHPGLEMHAHATTLFFSFP